MTDRVMRRGDLKPDLVIDLDDKGVPLPVTSATSVFVIAAVDGTMAFKRAVVPTVDGEVTMEWQPEDTDVPGTMVFEVEVVWPGTKPQTIRCDGVVRVLPDLG